MLNSALIDLLSDSATTLHDLDSRFGAPHWKADGFNYDNCLKTAGRQLTKQISTLSEKFTICVIGEFKVGKSTLLNGLLGLSGDSSLSAAESLDTACIVTLCERCAGDPEARLIFSDPSLNRDVTWKEARRYSSQVERNADAALNREAIEVEEIRYFFNSTLLHEVNFRDVPGTGTIYWNEHTAKAIEAIKTSDIIIWLAFDQEPGAQGTNEFMNVVARHRRRLVPVVNVRQEAGDVPDMDTARKVALSLEPYQRYFEEGIAVPLFYSARIAELERARPVPDQPILEASGYFSLVDHLFGAAASARRNKAKRTRISNECAAIFDRAILEVSGMLSELDKHRQDSADECRDFADRIRDQSAIHIHAEADLRLLGEAFARASCDTIRDICSRFIEDNLRADNWEALKIIVVEPTKNLTSKFAKELQRDYFEQDALLPACEKKYRENARHVLWSAWRTEKTWNGEIREQVTPERRFQAGDGEEMAAALAAAAAKIAVTAILVALVWIFQPFIVAAMPLGYYLLRNPMANLRQEAKERVTWDIHNWRVTLENRFVDAWSEESRRIKGEIEQRLGANQNASTVRFERFEKICIEIGDLLSMLRSTSQRLREAQSQRGTTA